MNRGSQNHHHHHHNHHLQDQNESQAQNNNSFQDYLQNSAHNLSFTNLHQNTSFDMDQENNHNHNHIPAHNMPLSPAHRSTNYIPQSFLSKPFEDNTYDDVEQRSQQWKLNWTQQHNSNNNPNTPIASNTAQLQNFDIAPAGAQNQQAKDSLWDSNYIGDHHANNALNPDLELASSAVINNFSGVLNDNALFNDAKDTPMHNRHSYRQNSLHENFGMDMEEDFHPSHNRFNQNQMDIEAFDQNGTPNLFKKNAANIIMNYDNYQQSIKVSDIVKTPYKNSSSINNNNNNHLIDSITNKIQQSKPFNYLFNHAGDHLNNDFRFSPIKSTKNIPFVTPSYFADKYESGYNHFGDLAAASDDFPSPKMEELQQAQKQNNNQSGNSNPQSTNTNQNNTANPQQSAQPCVCNCKKTKCLKLYCECFAKLGYCGEGCHCHECKNRPENEDERQNAIQEAKSRNNDAFQPKTESEQERKNKANNEQMKKGCNCRKTKCLKKYCECFNAGTYCNNMCKCDSCENHPRNAALILQKKNGSCGPQMASNIIQHHPTETVPPGLVVSQYNQGGYFQNAYGQLNLHQHVQSQHSRNQQDSHYLHPSQLYKSNKLQGRILFDDNNEESDPNNVYNKQSKEVSRYLLNKMRKQKKPIIKNRREGLENSDEEIENQSQDLSSQQSFTLLRASKRASNNDQNIISKDLDISDEEYQQQKQIEDMEKKLKQIQQMQLLLQQQQQLLKQEQEKILNSNQNINKDQQENHKLNNGQSSPHQILDSKLKKQKEELEQQFNANGWINNDSSQQRFISPPSSNFNNKDEDIDEEECCGDKDKEEQEQVKAHQILNGIKKNKKKHLKKKEQLSEEKKHQQKEKVVAFAKEKYTSYDEDQESSVSYSNYSTLTQFNQQNSNQQQANSQFRSRLNSENYEQIRQKSIQYNCQFSLLSSNPTKCSSNLFDPSSYSRQNEELYNKEFFPFQSQRIKKNSAHIIKAP
ncbi:tesmin TSO1-like CXC domain protein (macronuclear) [Tetrahymena thermophila SB210]|uniref:Tesmin TSO1-like CXC domain protein n=1 Tax=Tetrahymena thermophila (strain SB210) TaxID=312017 RepID=Q22YY5_TETTS|nr:tesmin TSO1-like CXC domain protein [Tetrahymena thermophila SB210]EAR90536.1 tesmin TSO1-like CXC domain protein [Tetrahymena thermophila SB210]|eukprot:XP_001010781.1 tesmin TSO1-like CXC domain protein [Tetrahymena thermophila SB210]